MIFDKVKKLKNLQNKIIETIKELTIKYNDEENIYNLLEKEYNNLYKVNKKIEKLTNKSQYEIIYDNINSLKRIYTVNVKPKEKEIDKNILKNIYADKEFYTEEEATTLLNWIVNNTMTKIQKSSYLYDDLFGVCGQSQFISLFPLEKLGLKITKNNVADLYNGCNFRHSFGSVFIPTKVNNQIITKQYLIDCSYRQFFLLKDCTKENKSPNPGYFIRKNEEMKDFSEELLQNGYIELNEKNAKKYAYGFYMSDSKESILETINKLEKENILENINTRQVEFDIDEDEINMSFMNEIIKNKVSKMN